MDAGRHRVVAGSLLVLSCSLLAVACGSSEDQDDANLPPIISLSPDGVMPPTSPPVTASPATAVPTVPPAPDGAATPVPPTITAIAPPAPPTSAPATTAGPSTTSAPRPSTTAAAPGTAGSGQESAGTWIMQLASAPVDVGQAAIDDLVDDLSQLTSGVRTLDSRDWPGSFDGSGRIVFYVGGFGSRDAVIAECGRIGRTYPDDCLARLLG